MYGLLVSRVGGKSSGHGRRCILDGAMLYHRKVTLWIRHDASYPYVGEWRLRRAPVTVCKIAVAVDT